MESAKLCRACDESLPLTEFYCDSRYPDGHVAKCRVCWQARVRERYDKRTRRSWRYQQIYNITVDDYEEILAQQNGCCRICGIQECNALKGMLYIDHDHKRGTVRGLLCVTCNAGLGQFKDDSALLAKAIVYLEESGDE